MSDDILQAQCDAQRERWRRAYDIRLADPVCEHGEMQEQSGLQRSEAQGRCRALGSIRA